MLCAKKRAGPAGKQRNNQDTASLVLRASTEPAGAAFFKNFDGLSNHRNAVASFRAGDQLRANFEAVISRPFCPTQFLRGHWAINGN